MEYDRVRGCGCGGGLEGLGSFAGRWVGGGGGRGGGFDVTGSVGGVVSEVGGFCCRGCFHPIRWWSLFPSEIRWTGVSGAGCAGRVSMPSPRSSREKKGGGLGSMGSWISGGD